LIFSVKTELMEEGANSTLSVARVNGSDSGNYTCSISKTEFATVTVHVLNGEYLPTYTEDQIICTSVNVRAIILRSQREVSSITRPKA